jgi:hypothetical protein
LYLLFERDKFGGEFLQATPELPIIIYINIKPLEIKIFEKEINTVLLRENYGTRKQKEVANYFKSDLDKNKGEIAEFKIGYF